MFFEGVLTISGVHILGSHIQSQLVKPKKKHRHHHHKTIHEPKIDQKKLPNGQEQADTITMLQERQGQLQRENARLVVILQEHGLGELASGSAASVATPSTSGATD